MIEKHFGIPQVSTGDIFRKAVAAKTELGTRVGKYLDAGVLVPDDVTVALVRDRLTQKDVETGFVLDGFPRTIPQAVGVEEILRGRGWDLDAVVNINIPADVLVPRLTLRRTCPSCGMIFHLENRPPDAGGHCTVCGSEVVIRPDDNVETVKKRIAVYLAQTSALVDYYRKKSKLIDVDGVGDADKVFERILVSLEKRPNTSERLT